MKRFLVLLGMLPGLVLAAVPAPQDFAYALPLELDGDGAIYRLDLPEVVYRHTHRCDLGDLRVFNGHAQVVPHLLRRPAPTVRQIPFSAPLPIFPLDERRAGSEQGDMAIHIRTNEQGAVVDLRRQGQPIPPQDKASAYLIDASALTEPLDRLQLAWPQSDENFMLAVQLEASDDLQVWDRVTGRHQLANLRHDGQQILHDTLQLNGLQARYLRLSWPLAHLGLPLESASIALQGTATEQPLVWQALAAQQRAAADEQNGEYFFDSGGHFPVERMELRLPENNTVVRVSLFSRADPEIPWKPRFRGLVYRLGELESATATLAQSTDRYWRLQVAQDGGGLGNGLPELRIGWQPHRLHFVARGEAPFMLAYGAIEVDALPDTGTQLIQELLNSREETLIKAARHGESYILGGPARLQAAPEPLPWRRWLLWGVLLLGVLLLAAMAWQLSRQLQSKT